MTYHDDEQLAWQAMEADDYVAAVPLLKPLAERNSIYALLSLGWIHEAGVLGEPDVAAARSLYEQAAQLGSGEAHRRLGFLFLDQDQKDEARAAFGRGVELGDEDSSSMLENFTANDQETLAWRAIESGEYKEALRLLEPLAAQNFVYSLLSLGWIYETGQLGHPDANLAHSYYKRAAKQGSTEANRRLGQLLLDQGRDEEARTAFQHGAEAGNISCMYWLGKMMLEGRGGAVEGKRGTEWLEAAAAQGHIFAKRKLLGFEARNSGSVLRKIAVTLRIVWLVLTGLRSFLKEPDADIHR